jgi:hypothetical protein
MQAHCPKCQSGHITRSKRRGWFESAIFALTHVRAYRCLSCDFRFFRRTVPHKQSASSMASNEQ